VTGLTLDLADWHFVAITVYSTDVLIFIDGDIVATRLLGGAIVDNADRGVLVGQLAPGKTCFLFFS